MKIAMIMSLTLLAGLIAVGFGVDDLRAQEEAGMKSTTGSEAPAKSGPAKSRAAKSRSHVMKTGVSEEKKAKMRRIAEERQRAKAKAEAAAIAKLPELKLEYYAYSEERIKWPKSNDGKPAGRRFGLRREESRAFIRFDCDVDKKYGYFNEAHILPSFKIQIDQGKNVFDAEANQMTFWDTSLRRGEDLPKQGRLEFTLDLPMPDRDAERLDFEGLVNARFFQGMVTKTFKNIKSKAVGDIIYEDKANEFKITRVKAGANRKGEVDQNTIAILIEHKDHMLLRSQFVDEDGRRIFGSGGGSSWGKKTKRSYTPKLNESVSLLISYAENRITQRFRVKYSNFELP